MIFSIKNEEKEKVVLRLISRDLVIVQEVNSVKYQHHAYLYYSVPAYRWSCLCPPWRRFGIRTRTTPSSCSVSEIDR
jgi:hypothetical protein